jgi:hypothetical protein
MSEITQSTRLTTDDALLLVINNQQEQARHQQEQARQAREQYEQSERMFTKLELRFDSLDAELRAANNKLDRIEKQVVELNGQQIAFKDGVDAQLADDLKEAAEEAEVALPSLPQHKARIQEDKKFRKSVAAFKVGQQLTDWCPTASRGDKVACGHWVSSKMFEIYNFRFDGQYPHAMRTLVDLFVGYWATKRDNSLRMY